MADMRREERALEVIAVSGRAAITKATDPDDREQLRYRTHELLADLERELIEHGPDEGILARIERERRHIWE